MRSWPPRWVPRRCDTTPRAGPWTPTTSDLRLAVLESGHDRVSRLALRLMSRFSQDDPTDILKVVFYRTQFFGTPFSDLVHDALRGPSFWYVGERELFASFTSQTTQCPFCTTVHRDF